MPIRAIKSVNFDAALECAKQLDGEQCKQLRDYLKATLDRLEEPTNRRARGKSSGQKASVNVNVRSLMAWADSIYKLDDAATGDEEAAYAEAVERVQALHQRLTARL